MKEDTAAAGARSEHLDKEEQIQAAEHTAPQALVIHEIVREEGEIELRRRNAALLWSGLAAGLSMGFSLLTLAFLQSLLPDEPWRRLLDSGGYCVGFVITVLGRQQLFTESTLTAVLPLMLRRDMATLLSVLRMWGIVLAANLVGTAAFAFLISPQHLFSDPVRQSLISTGREILAGPIAFELLKAVLAGWLIALMVWLLPSARSGSVEASFAVITGSATVGDYLLHFLLPTLVGNTIGGVALVGFLNHAPLASELREQAEEEIGVQERSTVSPADRTGRSRVRRRK